MSNNINLVNITSVPTVDTLAREPHHLILSADEQLKIATIINSLPPLHFHQVNGDFLAALELASYELPTRLLRKLLTFRQSSNNAGHLLIENLPRDATLPDTPDDGKPSKLKVSSVSEYCLLLTQTILGEPISYMDEKEGSLVQDICPVKGRETLQENSGSTLLEFHTEDGFHPNKPDFLALYCLRSDHDNNSMTYTASIRDVVQSLPTSAIELLRQPLFRIGLSSSFGSDNGKRYSSAMPVLTGSFFQPNMCVDFFAMEGLDSRASMALEILESALMNAKRGYTLRPGQLLVIDNRTAAHGRSSFSPRYDGCDRWLQRLFTIRDGRAANFSRMPGSLMQAPLGLLTNANSVFENSSRGVN